MSAEPLRLEEINSSQHLSASQPTALAWDHCNHHSLLQRMLWKCRSESRHLPVLFWRVFYMCPSSLWIQESHHFQPQSNPPAISCSPSMDFHLHHFSSPLARSAVSQTEHPRWEKNAMSTKLCHATLCHTLLTSLTFFSKRAKPASAAADSFRSSSLVLSGWKLFLKFSFCLFKLFAQRSMSLAIWNGCRVVCSDSSLHGYLSPTTLTRSFHLHRHSREQQPTIFYTERSAAVSLDTAFKNTAVCLFHPVNPSINPLFEATAQLYSHCSWHDFVCVSLMQ